MGYCTDYSTLGVHVSNANLQNNDLLSCTQPNEKFPVRLTAEYLHEAVPIWPQYLQKKFQRVQIDTAEDAR